jgi:DNA-binding YbaB/EbfC family protein
MFGENMMAKLQEMQQKMEESKSRLNSITVTGESADGKIKVMATGNRRISEITIDPSFMQGDKEELEDLLIVALNRALENADNAWESEMKGAAGQMLF